MRSTFLLSTLSLVGLHLISTPATAAGWTVSCSVGGAVVHTETLEEATAEQREREIRAQYPTAACVFLSESVPAVPVQASGLGGAGPYDLEAALRAISGESLEVAFPAPPSVEPIDVDPTAAQASAGEQRVAPNHRPATPGWIRLSMYRTGNIADALADWSRITTQEPSFRFLMPSVARVDEDYVMLSVGPVENDDRSAVCVAAESLGLECLAGPDIVDEESLAIEYLATVFPGAIDMPLPDSCAPAKPLAEYGQDLPPGMRPGLTCWRSGFAADRMFEPFDPDADFPVVAAIDTGYPPLPRPRPVRNP